MGTLNTFEVVVHELLHILGFRHEQNRPDRDQFVDIDWSNIREGAASNFFIDSWVDSSPPYSDICDDSGKPAGLTVSDSLVLTSQYKERTTPTVGEVGTQTPVERNTTSLP